MKIDLKKDISMPRLSKPKLGRPSIPGRSRGIDGPRSSRGADVKVPPFVADLYGDLRDRHLLPLVAVLIAVIIAAPIVFGGKGGSDEPVATANIPTGETSNSSFTVVPAESTLTTNKRLGRRHPLNPFRQAPVGGSGSVTKKQAREVAAAIVGAAIEASQNESSSSGTESPAANEISPIETGPVETPLPGGAEATEGKTAAESTTTESSSETMTSQAPQYVANVKAGFDPESLRTLEEVQPMTKLPSDKNPALLYIGLSQDQKRALFLMTSKVTAYYGAAHCALDKEACELVELKPGKSATFEIGLGEEATRYKVSLESIEPAESATETKTTETRSSKANARDLAVGSARPLQ